MKKKLKLTKLSKIEKIKGGSIRNEGCFCGCYWAGTPGGSSELNNYNYNWVDGLSSPPKR